MKLLNKVLTISLTGLIAFGSINSVKAEEHHSVEKMVKEKEELQSELDKIKSELGSIEKEVTTTETTLNEMKENIKKTKEEIEKKKEEIIQLEEKVYQRKDIMEQRIVSLQHSNQVDLVINIIFNAKNLSDFIQRATAASTILNADKELFEQQQRDLEKIEQEKEAIAKKEEQLEQQYKTLEENKTILLEKLAKWEEALKKTEDQYKQIDNQIALEKQKQLLAAKQKEAKKTAQTENNSGKQQNKGQATSTTKASQAKKSTPAKANTKNVLYVTATAYSHEDSKTGLTATGINVKKNPNMKLIAVDPSVIPLGTKVWVEGYGKAIAADTGGAIKGYKIDVLMPNNKVARQWGVKKVKLVIMK